MHESCSKNQPNSTRSVISAAKYGAGIGRITVQRTFNMHSASASRQLSNSLFVNGRTYHKNSLDNII